MDHRLFIKGNNIPIDSPKIIHNLTTYKLFSVSYQDKLNRAAMNEPCRNQLGSLIFDGKPVLIVCSNKKKSVREVVF